MIVSISAIFCEPPSSTSCFRDVTLFSSCFLDNENLLECPEDLKDIYWKWLKKYGAWDYIEDIVEPNYQSQISIRNTKGSITTDKINAHNLNDILCKLRKYSLRG
jgi:hypothetical protein